jgi:serine/threonine-protein kinase
MAIASSAALMEALRQSGLLDATRIDQLTESLHEHPRGPEDITNELVASGELTALHARRFLQDRSAELFLGPYLLLDAIGLGRVGRVFRARHRARGHIVAVKVLREDVRDDDQVLQRFRREVLAVSKLSHPNLVRACDVEEIGTAHFYAMEYVAGRNLAEVLDQVGALPVGPACDYLRQVALGLQHAHELGMIHRDIKPANMLIAPPDGQMEGREGHWGTVKLLDLGFARLEQPGHGDSKAPSLTMDGFALGTVDYMAPEQVMSPHDVDIRADLYALGCCGYHMLTGRLPFPQGELIDKLNAHQHTEPQSIEELRPEVPPALAGVLRKMMAKKPEARYPTPGEAAAIFATVLGRLDPSQLALDWEVPTAEPKKALPLERPTQPPEAVSTEAGDSVRMVVVGILICAATFVLCWLLVTQ